MTGWYGAPFVPADGQHWPLSVAAQMLDLPEHDLRDLVRIIETIKGESLASGTIKMNAYSRQGRQPRAYPAGKLIEICESIRRIADALLHWRQPSLKIPSDGSPDIAKRGCRVYRVDRQYRFRFFSGADPSAKIAPRIPVPLQVILEQDHILDLAQAQPCPVNGAISVFLQRLFKLADQPFCCLPHRQEPIREAAGPATRRVIFPRFA